MKKLFKLILFLGISTIFFILVLIFKSQNNQINEYSEYAFVLGAKANGGNLSKTLINRLETTYEYLTIHPNAKAVLCGGVENEGHKSQAEYMKEYLVRKGINENRLITEKISKNTFENIKLGLLKLDLRPKRITIISSDYHLFRAKLIARRFGVRTTTVPAKTPIGAIAFDYPREVLAVVKSFLFDKPTDEELKRMFND